MVKKILKGGMAFIDSASSCDKYKMCNVNDIKFATDYYHPKEFINLEDRPTNFALNKNYIGGKNKRKITKDTKDTKDKTDKSKKKTIKKGGYNTSIDNLYDLKNLDYKRSYQSKELLNLDDRPTNFALSYSYGGSKTTYSKKKEKTLKNLFFKLLEKSYLNYKSSITYKGGGDNIKSEFLANLNNTENLKYDTEFSIKPLNKIYYAPKSNFVD